MASRPQPNLSVLDVVAVTVGIVVGIGIFKTPALVAGAADSDAQFLLLWLAGGAISLLGALCYAELAASHPDAGGEYHFLRRAYGDRVGCLFAWGRITVIQTGAIAAVAFVLGDYAAQLVPLGRHGPAIYAAAAVAGLTAFNLRGLRTSARLQHVFTGATVAALAAIVAAGLLHGAPPAAANPGPDAGGAIGLAMIFVLLTYGGWNEAVYLSAEVRDVRRNMARALVLGIGAITVLYLAVNAAYVAALGLPGLRAAEVPAAELMRRTFGDASALVLSAVVVVAAVSTLNATVLTGARTSYALGRDFAGLGFLGRWDGDAMAPGNALRAQGAIALALVGFGALTRGGFTAMVEFTAPVFWLFFLLCGAAVIVLRSREPARPLPFRVPLYPLTPLAFCAACGYMLHASLAYTGYGALLGAAVLTAGLPVHAWLRGRGNQEAPRPKGG
ncbi:MAG: APC family permease [Pseudomonadota bacterium]